MQPCHQALRLRIVAGGAGEAGGAAEGAGPAQAAIGRQVRHDFVAEAEAELGVGEAAAEAEGRDVLAIGVELEARLKREALGQRPIVIAAEAGARLALLREIGEGAEPEGAGVELAAGGEIEAPRARPRVPADAEIEVDVAPHPAAVERFQLEIVEPAARRALARRGEIDAVALTADHRGEVPGIAVAALGERPFEPVEQGILEPGGIARTVLAFRWRRGLGGFGGARGRPSHRPPANLRGASPAPPR